MIEPNRGHTRRNLSKDVRWGLGAGLRAGLILAVVNALILAAGGGRESGEVEVLIASYLLGGIVGGLVLGLGRPLLSTRLGTFSVGALVATVGYGAVVFAFDRSIPLGGGLLIVAIVAVPIGGLAALLFKKHPPWR